VLYTKFNSFPHILCLYLHIVGHLFFVSVWSFWEERTCRFLAHLSFSWSKRCPASVCMSQTVHIFDFFIITAYQVTKLITTTCSSRGLEVFRYSRQLHLVLIAKHFRLLHQDYCLWSHQTHQKCFSRGPQEVLLLFRAIRNPTWLPQSLIYQDIFYYFSKTTSCLPWPVKTSLWSSEAKLKAVF